MDLNGIEFRVGVCEIVWVGFNWLCIEYGVRVL